MLLSSLFFSKNSPTLCAILISAKVRQTNSLLQRSSTASIGLVLRNVFVQDQRLKTGASDWVPKPTVDQVCDDSVRGADMVSLSMTTPTNDSKFIGQQTVATPCVHSEAGRQQRNGKLSAAADAYSIELRKEGDEQDAWVVIHPNMSSNALITNCLSYDKECVRSVEQAHTTPTRRKKAKRSLALTPEDDVFEDFFSKRFHR